MSVTETIWQRFRSYPRAMQWALLAAVGIAGFLLWDQFVWSQAATWNDQADRILARVDEVVKTNERRRQIRSLENPIRAIGAVERPGSQAQAGPTLTRTVNDILHKHGASKDNFSQRTPAKLKRGLLAEIVGPNGRLERLTADLRFNAAPEAATAIIADLESRPEIEAISSLRITRHGGVARVTVDLVLEAWITGGDEPARRSGGPI